jgi:hypothetical protein
MDAASPGSAAPTTAKEPIGTNQPRASVSRQPSWLQRQCACGDDDDDDSKDSNDEADASDDEDGDIFLALCQPATEDATEDATKPADAASPAVVVSVSPPTSDVPASTSIGLGGNPYAPVRIVELTQLAALSRSSSRSSSRAS